MTCKNALIGSLRPTCAYCLMPMQGKFSHIELGVVQTPKSTQIQIPICLESTPLQLANICLHSKFILTKLQPIFYQGQFQAVPALIFRPLMALSNDFIPRRVFPLSFVILWVRVPEIQGFYGKDFLMPCGIWLRKNILVHPKSLQNLNLAKKCIIPLE